MSNSQLQPDNHIAANPENTNVNVYLRLANSKSVKLVLPIRQPILELKNIIQKLTGIQTKNQILFYRGKELINGKIVKLKQKTIIHIKNVQQCMENITINIVQHLPQKRNIFKANFQNTPIKINPNETIQNFLETFLKNVDVDANIDYKRTKAIECGRFLHLSKTFLQEKIQTWTEIHLILRRKLQEKQVQNQNQQNLLIKTVLERSRHLKNREAVNDQISQIKHISASKDKQCKEQTDVTQPHSHIIAPVIISQTSTIEQPARNNGPSYFNPTKSSKIWQSQKLSKPQVTPLKFRFRQYNKYTGPKSHRECNCRRKKQLSVPCQHASAGPGINSLASLTKTSKIKTQSKRLKTKMSAA